MLSVRRSSFVHVSPNDQAIHSESRYLSFHRIMLVDVISHELDSLQSARSLNKEAK